MANYWVIDRTDWKGRNLFVASVICGKRALPLYWILLDKRRIKESNRSPERHSDFWIGTYGTFWVESMDTFSELAFSLICLKPQKTPYFSKGLTPMSFINQVL